MRRTWWLVLSVSALHAEWDSDIFSKSAELYDETREKTIRIYEDTIHALKPEKLTPQEERKKHLQEAWDETLDALQEGVQLLEEHTRVPDSVWIGRDKKDVQEDFDALLARIVRGLTNEVLEDYRDELQSIKKKMGENRAMIARYRERRISAPEHSKFVTTKSDYTDKIDAIKEKNEVLKNDMIRLKHRLQQRFEAIGVKLSSEQIEVLLTRVDGDDIIRMALVIDTVRYMTEQIGALMKQSGESLTEAKRYYAMYLVLQELTLHVQQSYLNKCRHRYLPKIDKIIADAKMMIDETARLKSREESTARRKIYATNIRTLKQTLNAARRYRSDLLQSCRRIEAAKAETLKNLSVARNTYKTVMLSSDLYALIEQSGKEFLRIGQIQVPEIIPFENLQLQKAYGELTEKLK
jgi:DNA-binding transcriptional regulator YbjK